MKRPQVLLRAVVAQAVHLALVLIVGAMPARASEPVENPVVLGGYAEAFYQWNFNEPDNGLSNFRGFDNRHNSFTLSNVVLDALWDHVDVVGRLTLQVGHTPSTYYLGEPSLPGSPSSNASGRELWQFLQQAYAGYRFPLGGGLTLTAGLFLSPIGPESMAVRDNWNFSRSNAFFALPFYHTGVRATYALNDAWALTFAVYNGWNSVVDQNADKSVSAQVLFTRRALVYSLLYFGGVERGPGALEGRAVRHLIDTHVTWHATPWLSLIAHADAGLEPNAFGASHWVTGALYTRIRVLDVLYVAVRGDGMSESPSKNDVAAAAPIFWPVAWVASGTATLDYRPQERVSLRLEVRHDHAAGEMFFGGAVPGDGMNAAFVANRVSQDTLTVGAVAWF